MERSYRYLGYYFILFIPLVLVAFYRTYLVQFPNLHVNFNKLLHLHAFLACVWIAMLIAQPLLIVNKKLLVHRVIGKLSYVVFPLLILLLVPRVIEIAGEGDYGRLSLPVGDMVVMIPLYVLAIYNRKDTPKHMRYMIASSLPLLGPTVGRIGPIFLGWSTVFTQTVQYSIMFGILTALILFDRKQEKNYKPYLVAVYLLAASSTAFYMINL